MSWELKRLSKIENEFKKEYEELSEQCQEYASALINETRNSLLLSLFTFKGSAGEYEEWE